MKKQSLWVDKVGRTSILSLFFMGKSFYFFLMFREIKLLIWQIIIKDEVCGVDSDIGNGVKKHDLRIV